MYIHTYTHICTHAHTHWILYGQSGMTALHLGVSHSHIEVVEELASRADPSVINAVDNVSTCTLHSITCDGCILILMHNFQHGYTPLILATKLKNEKLIEVLYMNGANVNVQTNEVYTSG